MKKAWIILSILTGLLFLDSLFRNPDQLVATFSGMLFALSFAMIFKNQDAKCVTDEVSKK